MPTVFWVFKKEILKRSVVKNDLPLDRFCFKFWGDSGNDGFVIYLDEYGNQQELNSTFNYEQIITVSASSIVTHSDNFEPVTC